MRECAGGEDMTNQELNPWHQPGRVASATDGARCPHGKRPFGKLLAWVLGEARELGSRLAELSRS